MAGRPPTKSYPFGHFEPGDEHILVICQNEMHRERVVAAFGIKAHYIASIMPAITGVGYDKIIVFYPEVSKFTPSQVARYEAFIRDLHTQLYVGGKVILV